MLNQLKSFGMNIIPENREKIEYAAESVETAINGLWEPILTYLKDNDNVFSGEVLDEIDNINYQTMRLNMTMNSTTEKRRINYDS